MTNKSIGNFLAELRKEKGLTQKEIADYLNVSDKTVSHWECDKYSPDISAIPVLADFFGVTCDEILRGERKAPEEREESQVICETETDDTQVPPYAENNFSYEPLTEQSEFEKFAKIKMQNAYNKLKFRSLIAVFTAFFVHAIFFVIIKLIGGYVAIYNFDLYAVNISAIFSVALGAIIILSSYLKFTGTLSLCNFQKTEYNKWKRKAIRFPLLIPLMLFIIVFINSMIQMAPVEYENGSSTVILGTTLGQDEEDHHTTTTSPYIPIPTSNTNEGDPSVSYITGEDLLTSNP